MNHVSLGVIDGERFGTRAEGEMRARLGSVVGMTLCPEAAYAMQLDLEYAVAAFPVERDFDANHENTGECLRRLSAPDRVPALIGSVIGRCGECEPVGCRKQLEGNVIPCSDACIRNCYLKKAVIDLIEKYC